MNTMSVTEQANTHYHRDAGTLHPDIIEIPGIVMDGDLIRGPQQIAHPFVDMDEKNQPRQLGWEAEFASVPADGNTPDKPIPFLQVIRSCQSEVEQLLRAHHGTLSPETSPHACEIGTDRGYGVEEAAIRFIKITQTLSEAFAKQGVELFSFGKYPLEMGKDELTTYLSTHPNPYYRYILKRDGADIASAYDALGLQFHYGQEREKEKIISIFNAIQDLCPLFAALSASSPVFYNPASNQLERSTWDSSRLKIKLQGSGPGKSGVPRAGYFGVFENFNAYLEKMHSDARKFRSLSFGGALVRAPRILGSHPSDGEKNVPTIEMCAMDMNPDMTLNIALMDLYHRVCEQIGNYHDQEKTLPRIFGVLKENPRLADANLRNSLESSIPLSQREISDRDGKKMTFMEMAKELFDFIQGTTCQVNSILQIGTDDDTRAVIQRTIIEGNTASKIIQTLRTRLDRDSVWAAYMEQNRFPGDMKRLTMTIRERFQTTCK